MDLADLIIVIFLLGALLRGAEVGSLKQIFSAGGFFGGLFLGAWLQPHFIHFAHSATSRSWLTLIITLGFALIFLACGEYIGTVLKSKLEHHRADYIDRGLGSLVAAISVFVTVWLGATILLSLPYAGLQTQLRGSKIVSSLDKNLPSAPNVIASVSRIIEPNGFPQVFSGIEPAPANPNVALPPLSSLATAIAHDQASVVKIEGEGCGGIVEGSGFVAAPGLIITNAHVVAGVAHSYVIDKNGQHATSVMWFDPNLDLAVLAVKDLAGQALTLDDSTAPNGTAAAVLGYPGGGDFTPKPAAVLDEFTATGRNIYDQANTNRSVYEIKADVIPGNSGGPLVTRNGAVIGVVFAQSTAYNEVGYALTMQQVTSELHQAEKHNQSVSTGACAE